MTRQLSQHGSSQRGFVKASQIPYLLLALAAAGLFFFWNNIQTKNKQIAEIEQTKAAEIAKLDAKIQTDTAAMSELNNNHMALQADHDQLQTTAIPNLKRDLSFAKAENQRSQHVQTARDNLIGQLQVAKQENAKLASMANQLPEVQKQLSFSKAQNARLQHVADARDRLIAQAQGMQAN